MSIEDKIEDICKQFSVFSEWEDKYSLLIQLGNNCPKIDPKDKNDSFLINGCQSRLWLKPEFRDNKIYFFADADALITKGMVGLLIHVFDGESPRTLLDVSLDFLDRIGLTEHLSATRSNGLNAMIKQIKLYAMALNIKNAN